MVSNTLMKVAQSGLKLYWLAIYALILSLMIYASFHVMYLPPSEHSIDVYFKYQ